METCVVKWILIGTGLLITLIGLWLAVWREIRNIKTGKRDIQKIIYDKANKTINAALASGILLIGLGIFTIIYTAIKNIGCDTTLAIQPIEKEEAKILFKLAYDQELEFLRLLQKAPQLNQRNIVKQESGYFEENVKLPTQGSNFFAHITPLLKTNTLGDNVVQTPLEICFQRTKPEIREDGVLTIIYADEDKIFKQESGDPGCVTLCNEEQTSFWQSVQLFPRAYAQPNTNENRIYGWSVPNLQTLKEERKTGFSEIIINSEFLSTEIERANRYYYSVKINDIPIFFDGLLPKHILNPFNYENGFQLEFGIENLGFSGNENGFEKIDISIHFLQETEPVKTIRLNFDYVALRRNEPNEITTNDGSTFEWEAFFTANQENQIFIGSMPTADGAVYTKKRLHAKALTFEGKELVGVIRPPYKNNDSYGVCVGLLMPNKQIQFTFDNNQAAQLKAYLRENNYRPLIRLLSDN